MGDPSVDDATQKWNASTLRAVFAAAQEAGLIAPPTEDLLDAPWGAHLSVAGQFFRVNGDTQGGALTTLNVATQRYAPADLLLKRVYVGGWDAGDDTEIAVYVSGAEVFLATFPAGTALKPAGERTLFIELPDIEVPFGEGWALQFKGGTNPNFSVADIYYCYKPQE